MRKYEADSYTVYCEPTVGRTDWPFAFEDDYIDKSFVKARFLTYEDTWEEFDKQAFTVSGNTLTLRRGLRPVQILLIYRDTPKTDPWVVYGNGRTVIEAVSRNVGIRQSMHCFVEFVDVGKRRHASCLCDCATEVPA